MKIESVVFKIENLMSKQRYGAAREVILKEWNRITEPNNFHMLSQQSKDLVKVIAKEKETNEFAMLTNKDKRILSLLNEAVRDVKLPYAKKIFFEHKELINQAHAQKWLTSDARFMCFAWQKKA
ncbi:hypothetical protein J7I80_20620 [Bacillus sp. ISL-41]|uniref:hypothetical protein n=1 Tax=Bacillus sp. ISL-41 TaxID=2819127 RepID=UPI001BEB06A9|nr:hypothetical protein [Bacillus sp. ISL-41]MBT2644624.1 hypothetical protein [Bacillus sp. ISL-41]